MPLSVAPGSSLWVPLLFLMLVAPPTQGQVPSPRRLRVKVSGPDALLLTWKEPKGDCDGYEVVYSSPPGGEEKEVSVDEPRLLLEEVDVSQEFQFRISAVRGAERSRPLLGEHAAQRGGESVQPQRRQDLAVAEDNNAISEEPEVFVCDSGSIADIVVLVDGSWSIGRINFRLVRLFLESLVRAFNVDQHKTRIGLAQYSGDPRMEWHLNTHATKEAVIDAMKNLPYKGGNTLTGLALTFILENSFKPEAGSRDGVPKIGILITDGKSQDDVIPPARSLRQAGIQLFAIGVKNADEVELRAIASPPEEEHVYNVADFNVMADIVEGLTRNICDRVETLDRALKGDSSGPSPPVAPPRDLLTSEVTARSFRVSWSPAPGQVEKYRVVYYPASGGQPEEKVVPGQDRSVVLSYLNSLTEYQVAVFAVYRSSASEALRGSATTLALPMVQSLNLTDLTHSTMRVAWQRAAGASGYMILYAPLTEGEPADEKEVKVEEEVQDVELEGLTPDTEYTVTVYALYGDEASDPITSQRTTLPLNAARDLRFSAVDHSSALLHWDSASRLVKGYRVMYVKTDGVQTNEVDAGQVTSWLLRNLTSETEYTVAIFAVYDEGQAEPITESFTTEVVPEPQSLSFSDVSTDSFRLSWKPAASDVVLYRVTWGPSLGGATQEFLLEGGQSSYLVRGLSPSTEYTLSVVALYSDQSASSPASLRLSTVERTTTITTTTVTTSAPLYGVRSLVVGEESTSSLTLSWSSVADSRQLRHYLVDYVSTKGDRAPETTTVAPGRTSLQLLPLLSDTEYRITLTPVYQHGNGPSSARLARTLPLSPPRSLRVSEEWYNRFRISWDAPPSPTMGYRVVYKPVSGPGPALETFVGEDVGTMLIVNLLSGTDYSVKLIASYSTGASEALTARAKTLYLGVTSLTSYQVRVSSMCAQWQPHRHANAYRVVIESILSGQRQEAMLGGGASRHCFSGLLPAARHKVSVSALLPDGTEGPATTLLETTIPSPTPPPTKPPTTTSLPTIPAAKEVCRAAKADLVFLVDGSWSIGDDNFQKIINFLYSTAGALDGIGPTGTQVAIAQFSDDPRTEFKLNSYSDKQSLLDAIKSIAYKGGNTKTGRAIAHVKDSIFTEEGGMRRGVPNVLVVLTDGRSQDDVNKVSKEMQLEGHIVFAIGFADADYGELVSIASAPSERHVFFVDDLDAFQKIEEKLVTFVCEAASATCPSVPLSGSNTPGFRMMEHFSLVEGRHADVPGVSMVPGTFNTFPSFLLHSNALLSQPTKFIHPEGLPSDYTISLMFRLVSSTPPEPFALWEILNLENQPLVGVILDNGGKTLTFFNNDYRGEFQTVTFEGPHIKKLFYGSFHKLHLSVSKTRAQVVVDCQLVEEKAISAAGNISTDGQEVLGRMVRSRDNRESSAPFQLQSFDIVCSTSWAGRDKCCELPGLRKEGDCPALPRACSCSQDSKGPPGPTGPPGGPGIRGSRGDRGEPGPVGPVGLSGTSGSQDLRGRRDPKDRPAAPSWELRAPRGRGGRRGVPGSPGATGREGQSGPRGLAGKDGPTGRHGPPGPIGGPGNQGAPGNTGSPGKQGDLGPPGPPGTRGEKGERGDLQSSASVQSIARQVCEQLIQNHLARYSSILNQVPSQPVAVRSVPGPPGEPGRSGAPGPQGEQGPGGRPGFPGSNGENGLPGARGDAGEKGEKGSQGVGIQGPRGTAGPPGSPGQGRTGSQGSSGRPGNPGPPGRSGVPGSVGPSGPPGYCDQNACMGYNVGVQLPSSSFQNYEEADVEDPYRYGGGYPSEYYQPNYPAPRPVAPDDPSEVHRSARSLTAGAAGGAGRREEEVQKAVRSSLTERLRRGAQKGPGTK